MDQTNPTRDARVARVIERVAKLNRLFGTITEASRGIAEAAESISNSTPSISEIGMRIGFLNVGMRCSRPVK